MKADRKTKSHSRAKATKPRQQRVKNSLQESERRFCEMFEKIQLIAVSLDLEGRITFCNEFLLQLTGYSSDEVLGCDWFTQFVPDIRSDVKETFLQSLVLGEIVAHYENPIRTKSSADRFIRFSNTILRDEEGAIIGTTSIGEDITELKRAEEKLRENEEWFRTLFEKAGEGIFILSVNGEILAVNGSFAMMHGYSVEEMQKMNLNILDTPDSAMKYAERIRRILAGEILTFEVEHFHKNGHTFPLEVTSSTIAIGSEKYFLAFHRDITERKQAEDALAKEQKHFRALIENGVGNISLLAADGSLLWESPSTTHILGYAENEFLNHNILELVHPDDLSWVQERFAKLAQTPGSQERSSFRLRHQNGSWRWTEAIVTNLLNDPSVEAIVINYHDITERKQANEALRENEERFRRTFYLSPDSININRLNDGMYVSINNGFTQIMGYTEEEIIGRTSLGLNLWVNPQDRETLVAGLKKNGVVANLEARFRAKNGDIRDGLMSASIIELNGISHIVSITRDITERKAAEKQIYYQANLLASVQDAIIGTDIRYHIQHWNAAAQALYGWKAEEVLGHPLAEFIQNDYLQGTLEDVLQQITEKGYWKGEVNQNRRDGTKIPILASVSAIKDPLVQPIGFVAVNRDITERKRAEAERVRLNTILEATTDFVALTDKEGQLLYLGRGGRKMVVMGEDEEISKVKIGDCLTEPSRALFFKKAVPSAVRDGTWSGDAVLLSRDGREIPTSQVVIAHKAPDGTIEYYSIVAREIRTPTWTPPSLVGFSILTMALVLVAEVFLMFLWSVLPPLSMQVIAVLDASLLSILVVPVFYFLLYKPMYKPMVSHISERRRLEEELKRYSEYLNLLVEERTTELKTSNEQLRIEISEHKRIEEEIRRLKEFDENLINNMSEGIAVQNIDGDFTYVNPAASSITGYLPGEILGVHWTKFFPADQHQIIKEADNQRLDGKSAKYEIDFMHKSGKLINMLISGSPLLENERFNGTMAVFTDITVRKEAEKKIRQQLKYLTSLSDIDHTIASTFDMQLSLHALLSHSISVLSVDAAAILLLHSTLGQLEYIAGLGFQTYAIETTENKIIEGYAARVVMERRLVKIPNLADEPDNLLLGTLLKGEKFVSYYGVPLIVKGKVIGVLEVFHRSYVKHDQDWLDFLIALADQAAIAINNAQLFDGLQQSNTELVLAYDATIEGWSRAMDLRDKETEGHTQRVTSKVLELARKMEISESELIHIRRGALLHDIGKLGVPDAILLKPDKLTDEEWGIMRQHPTYAYEMLSPIAYLKPALDIPYCHHEKWDGTGYPRGLKGEQIPQAARIFAIVDVWDALRSDRPYRAGWLKEKTLEYIREQSGKHFDPQIMEFFLLLVAEYPG